MADLTYNGTRLIWSPKGEKTTHTFNATSGIIEGGVDYRVTEHQCTVDRGPLPEGRYALSLQIDAKPARGSQADCVLQPSWSIQTIPRGLQAGDCEPYWANWGENRVRLEPADRKTREACKPRRGGFYLHDSAKGYTHGCIETEKSFFTLLRKYAISTKDKQLILQIVYSSNSTYGETDL